VKRKEFIQLVAGAAAFNIGGVAFGTGTAGDALLAVVATLAASDLTKLPGDYGWNVRRNDLCKVEQDAYIRRAENVMKGF